MGQKAAKFAERTRLRAAYAECTPVTLAGVMNSMRERMRHANTRVEQDAIKAHKAAIRFHMNAGFRERQLAYREV